jgi:uncharacterized surface protein with fasciclin (FAS1) repeats
MFNRASASLQLNRTTRASRVALSPHVVGGGGAASKSSDDARAASSSRAPLARARTNAQSARCTTARSTPRATRAGGIARACAVAAVRGGRVRSASASSSSSDAGKNRRPVSGDEHQTVYTTACAENRSGARGRGGVGVVTGFARAGWAEKVNNGDGVGARRARNRVEDRETKSSTTKFLVSSSRRLHSSSAGRLRFFFRGDLNRRFVAVVFSRRLDASDARDVTLRRRRDDAPTTTTTTTMTMTTKTITGALVCALALSAMVPTCFAKDVTWDAMADAAAAPAPAPADDAAAPAPAPTMDGERTVVDVAIEDPRFATLVTAVVAVPEVLDTLETPGPWTVFAPSNEAIATFLAENGLTAEQLLASPGLGDVLKKHVVASKLLAADAVNAVSAGPITLTTLNGDVDARMVDGTLYVGGAAVVQVDIMADNGVVHVIDRVIQ